MSVPSLCTCAFQDTDVATYVDTTASIIYDPARGSKGNTWLANPKP